MVLGTINFTFEEKNTVIFLLHKGKKQIPEEQRVKYLTNTHT